MRAEPVNLNEVITNLAKLLKRVIGASIVLECAFPEQLACVEADVSMMEQVLLNLVVNSRDAMPRGGQLLITTERVVFADTDTGRHPDARAGEFICWAVSDTGCGIAPEHLPRIFEPFYTTKEPGKGTGLGLAMVYGIVKQHRGWVELQTQPGVGTTFQIFLPAIAAPATAKHAESSAATLHGGSERILLVENDPAVRLLTRRLLETFGYHVLEATSGNDAWELSSRAGTNVDLLLTGLVTTDGMTGPVLAQRLRKKTPHLKVIFVSGNSRESTNYDTAFLRRNQDRFLQKPYASQVLLGMVRRCLDGEARGIGAQAT
jgi:CheY-like chemotaxis protein